MSYEPARDDMGHDATPDWPAAAGLVGTVLAAIPHKTYPEPGRWTIAGWRYVGTDGWADVDSAGVCYATGTARYPDNDRNPA